MSFLNELADATASIGYNPLDMTTDRSHWPTRKIALEDEGKEAPVQGLSPGELVAMVHELTLQAWAFKDGRRDEPRLRRDVVRVVRSGR